MTKPHQTPSAARTRLANAIETRRNLTQEREQISAAELEASDQFWGARQAIEDAQAVLGKARPDTGAFLSAFALGGAPDMAMIERPVAEAEAALAVAKRGASHWRSIADDLKTRASAIDREIDRAAREVKESAAAVVRAEADPAAILDGLAELEAEVAARRAVLHLLSGSDLIRDEHRTAVKAALREVASPLATLSYTPPGYSEMPIVQGWRSALQALERDAAAPLPR